MHSRNVVLLHKAWKDLCLKYVNLRIKTLLSEVLEKLSPHCVNITQYLFWILDLLDQLSPIMMRYARLNDILGESAPSGPTL
jgi:hypothetical protein